MKKVYFFVVFISLLFISIYWNIVTYENYTIGFKNYIRKNSNEINSINPNDTNFNDLEFLIEILKNNKVLFLGESLHYDGTTFLAKTRLVKFLHEKLGYDVLLFETGKYETWLMTNSFKQTKLLSASTGMYEFWSNSNEMKDLWRYVENDLNCPLRIFGFDIQFSGNLTDSSRAKLLVEYLEIKNIDISNYKNFFFILPKLKEYSFYSHENLGLEFKDSILLDLDNLINVLDDKLINERDSVYLNYLSGMRYWFGCVWKYQIGDPNRFQIRDSLMAQNILNIIANEERESKVIIWCSNLHGIYDNKQYTSKEGLEFTTMANYIKTKYKDESYSIVFSNYCRMNSRNLSWRKASNKSLEYYLHSLNNNYCFINFRTFKKSYQPFDDGIIIRANQEINYKGNWFDMIDGYFFIDTMKSCTY